MIVIVSNGKQYSDHRLYFVEAPSIADVEAVMNPLEEWMTPPDPMNPDARVVGTCQALAWSEEPKSERTRFQTMSLEAFTQRAKEYL
jgi:hypothetical protein